MSDAFTLPDDLRIAIASEATANGRTESEQIAHWLTIGRAVEGTESFDFARVRAALTWQLPVNELTETEHAVWSAAFVGDLMKPTPEESAFFAERQAKGLGVGLDGHGNIVDALGKTKKPSAKRASPPIHPGIWLDREFLRRRGISVTGFADRCGLPGKTAQALLAGEIALEAGMAQRIEAEFEIVFGTLMRMQSNFDESLNSDGSK